MNEAFINAIKQSWPVDTGKSRQSFGITEDRPGSFSLTGSPYAVYVHKGMLKDLLRDQIHLLLQGRAESLINQNPNRDR